MNFSDFIKIYGDAYPKEALNFIITNFGKRLPINNPDILNQLYDVLNMYQKENTYLTYLKLLEEYFDVSSNILEIGGGFYPAFATHIRDRQLKTKKGTITVYDKMLVTENLPNIKLVKKNFTEQDSVKQYDLLVGILPCEATTLIIKKANEENKEFFLVLCNCTHFSKNYLLFNIPTVENWHNYIIELFEKTKKEDDKLIILQSPTKYSDYKILIKKKKN